MLLYADDVMASIGSRTDFRIRLQARRYYRQRSKCQECGVVEYMSSDDDDRAVVTVDDVLLPINDAFKYLNLPVIGGEVLLYKVNHRINSAWCD